MSLPTVKCNGKIWVDIKSDDKCDRKELTLECIKVKKVFDEFALRDCVEGIRFELERRPAGNLIDPILILKGCEVSNVEIKDVSTNSEKRLKFSGKCCCEVFGKDERGNIIRMRVVDLPESNRLSIGPCGELCFNFNVRREYPDTTEYNFNKLLHFLDEGRFELQCFSEAVIDEDNNETTGDDLVTNLGIFIAIKFDAEVQLCIPVLGYCFIEEEILAEESFCEKFECEDVPSFNPPQLDKSCEPYDD